MKIKTRQLAFLLRNLGLGIAVAMSVAACGQTDPERDLSINIDGSEIVSQVGYVPLPEEGYLLTQIHFQRGKVGTVFDGDSVFNLTIGELLRQQASF